MREVPPSSQTFAHPSHLEKSSPADSSLTIFLEFHAVFSFQKLLTCRSHMLIKFNKTKFFRETQRIMIEMLCINKT